MQIYDRKSPYYTKTILGINRQEAIEFKNGDVIEKIVLIASDIVSTAKTVAIRTTTNGAVISTETLSVNNTPVKSSLTFLVGEDAKTLYFTPSFGSVDVIITYRNPQFHFVLSNFSTVGATASTSKRYAGTLVQTSTNAPVFTSMVDDLGAPVWARSTVGTYTLTKTGAFPLTKTIPPVMDVLIDELGNKYTLTHTSANVMTLKTYAVADLTVLADGILNNTYLEIEILP